MEAHPYYIAYQTMRQREYDVFSKKEQSLIQLICWDIELRWFQFRKRKQERDFIDRFGIHALPERKPLNDATRSMQIHPSINIMKK